jgi:hypothetical protein
MFNHKENFCSIFQGNHRKHVKYLCFEDNVLVTKISSIYLLQVLYPISPKI